MKRYKLMARDAGLIVGLFAILTVLSLLALFGASAVAYVIFVSI